MDFTPLFFSFDELEAAGCINDPSVSKPDLRNEIHQLFESANWPSLSVELDQLIPALRLASRFLTDVRYRGWWRTIALQRWIGNLPPKDGKPWLIKPVHASDEADRMLAAMFDLLRRHITFSVSASIFTAFVSQNHCSHRCIGLTFYSGEAQCGVRKISIVLHPSVLIPAHQPVPLEQRLRLDFCIAILLCHEIAHALNTLQDFPFEPVFGLTGDYATPELGYAFENHVFGGVPRCINEDMSAEFGLYLQSRRWARIRARGATDAVRGTILQRRMVEE